jgi:hypothetical protein
MQRRVVTVLSVLLVVGQGARQGFTAEPGASFEEWQKRDQDAWRTFQGRSRATPSRQGVRTVPRTDDPPELPPDEHAAAALIADGDETEPVVLPAGPELAVVGDAGWAARHGTAPGGLLDALDGGRPGGDVSTMLALLRQTQGPFTEAEEQTLIKRFVPYAESDSEAAHAAIRQQNEALLRAMIYRQMMVQTAWEYDFALADAEIAKRMGDTETLEEAELLAEIQRQMAQEQQGALEAIRKEMDSGLALPTPEEVQAEDKAKRDNAVAALELPAAVEPPEGKVLLGYLKLEKTFFQKHDYVDPWANEQGSGVWHKDLAIDVNEGGVTYCYTLRLGVQPPSVRKYTCSWSIPKLIPCYGERRGPSVVDPGVTMLPLRVELTDAGSTPGESVICISGNAVSAILTQCDTTVFWGDMDDINPEYNRLAVRVGGGASSNANVSARLDKFPMPHPDDNAPCVAFCIGNMGEWIAYWGFKWDPVEQSAPAMVPPDDPDLGQEQNEAIAEHQANIASTEKVLKRIEAELANEQNPTRREDLRQQALHMRQNIHDSKDLIESIRTGTIVKTRGPWDEHAAVVLAETSRKLREDCLRAQQMQANYARMAKILERMKPEDAKRFYDSMAGDMIRGIHEPGGFERAQKALAALHATTMTAAREAQQADYADQAIQFANLAGVERDLYILEGIKRNCDRGIFVGSLFMGMGAGTALTMAYEGSCTGFVEGPKQAAINAVIQGGVMLGAMGVMKIGSWGIGKLLNPKVGQSQVNTFKNILEKNRYDQEMEWNRALVNQVKERVSAFEKCKLSGGKDYLKIRMQLDDAVGAANSSALAKRIMKNELTVLQNEIKSGATRDYTKLRDCLGYQKVFDNRLQKSIYPRTDAEVVRQLKNQGYNVDTKWFCDFRNSCSRGVNADRDFGLLYEMEGLLTKNGRQASMTEVMKDGQKAYNAAYKQVTGHSATLADQSFTTSTFSESFPLSWLEGKVAGPSSPAFRPVRPDDFEKAGNAIFNKVQNALKGHDPAFVKMKGACASLSKDLRTKVLERLANPPASSTISSASRKAAQEHWRKVEKVMNDFATDQCDPLTAMRDLQRLTGSTSVTESAAQVQRLVNRLGGGTP